MRAWMHGDVLGKVGRREAMGLKSGEENVREYRISLKTTTVHSPYP